MTCKVSKGKRDNSRNKLKIYVGMSFYPNSDCEIYFFSLIIRRYTAALIHETQSIYYNDTLMHLKCSFTSAYVNFVNKS